MLKYICRDHKSITKLLHNVLPLMTLQYFSGPWENIAKPFMYLLLRLFNTLVVPGKMLLSFTLLTLMALKYFSGSLENIAKLLL